MKQLHTAASIVPLTHLRNVLEQQGIACEVRNQFLAGAMGEIPSTECWPQLWIVREDDWPLAQEVLAAVLAEADTDSPGWTCAHCGEQVEGQFAICWNCEKPRDD